MKKTELAPHVRLTADQVCSLFKMGHLRPTGYLYLLLSALKQHGWKHRVEKVDDFCKQWGISRSAFYRSKAKLISEGLLTEDIVGAVDISTHEISTVPESGTGVPESGTTVPESGTTVPESGTGVPESGTTVPESGTGVPESGTGVPELRQTEPESIENNSIQGFPNSSSILFTECLTTLDSTHTQIARAENQESECRSEADFNFWQEPEPHTVISKTELHQATEPYEIPPSTKPKPVQVKRSTDDFPAASREQESFSKMPEPLAVGAISRGRLSNIEKSSGDWWGRWRTGSGPNQWNEGFVDWMGHNWIHGSKRDRPAVIGYLVNCEADRTGAMLQKLEALFDAYEQSWEAKTGHSADQKWLAVAARLYENTQALEARNVA